MEPMTPALPRNIERFELQRVLGSGVQGTVYLARDPRLDRQVAIKTLAVGGTEAEHRGRVDTLLAEARIAGQLSHPNIVPLYDAGEDAGVPYLVFEYVQGQVLSEVLAAGRKLPVHRALDITIQILKAVGYAHQKGVVHRDLKPGNIMLTREDTGRVMDFGIAQLISSQAPHDAGFCGTPVYTAPEYLEGAGYTPRADLYSIAMMLYRMLTGRTAAIGTSAAEVLTYIDSAQPAPPSRSNDEIDDRLDDLVLKGLARNPEERFASAAMMEDSLYLYLNPEPETTGPTTGPGESSTGTLGFLLRRMRHKSDFPALSATITAINQATASEDEGADALCNSILKDFALTSKLLKMVNTAAFGNFGGTISTISRAVVIMGFDRIRNAAITLMLLEHLQNKAHAARLKDDLLASYFSGILAQQLTVRAGIRNPEEAFICATFHNLGRLLTSFYFPEEGREIDRLIQQKRVSEAQASFTVLGVSFEDLGIGVARAWNFPARVVQSMRHIGEDRVRRPSNEDEKLRALADLSTGVCDAMRDTDDEQRAQKLEALVGKFGDALNIESHVLALSIQKSAAELARDPIVLGLKTHESVFLAGAKRSGERYATAVSESDAELLQTALSSNLLSAAALSAEGGEAVPEDPKRKSLLFDGIQDVTAALMDDFKLNDVLRAILSTMYRSMGFTRVLLYVRDTATNTLKIRFGMGLDVDKIVAGKFSIALSETKDVFQAALARGADVFIENVNAETIRKHIPDAYRHAIPALSFALFPIVVKGSPIGLFYGDSDVEGAIRFSPEELSLLKTLRNQAVIAIRQTA